MRPMRLQKREVKEQAELRKILDACQVLRIGTMDEEGMFIVPVNFGYEFYEDVETKQHLRFYIHSAREGRKADAFARNPKVAFEMDREQGVIRGDYTCSYSFAYSSIMGNGMIRKVEEEQEKLHGLGLLMEHMAPEAELEFLPPMLERVAVYCIEADLFSGKRREV